MVPLIMSPTLSFCSNRDFIQTAVINGSMKRHTDNGINRTQVLSVLCHGGESSLDPDVQMGPTQPEQWQNPASASTLRKSRTEWVGYQGGVLHHPGAGLDHRNDRSCTPPWLFTSSKLVGCYFPISQHHTQNRAKSPTKPSFSSKISPSVRTDLDLCPCTPLLPSLLKTLWNGWQRGTWLC